MTSNEKFCTNKKSLLHSQENFLFVHKIKERPFHQYHTNAHHYCIKRIAHELSKPAQESISAVIPIDKSARHIDQDGIHSDYFEEERPFFMTENINDVIKQREQQKADAAYV